MIVAQSSYEYQPCILSKS